MLKGKKLLILGGDMLSVDIVKTAQSMGVYTIVTDWYDTNRSPAKLIADQYADVSTTDIDALSKLVIDESIDGVLTGFTDSTLPSLVALCEKFELPCYLNMDQVAVTTNKDMFKQVCEKHDIPIITEYSNVNDNIEFPVIVKPVDNSGARGIRISHNISELKQDVEYALQHSPSQNVLIERYISGEELTAFYVAVNGSYYLVAIGDRHVRVLQEGHIPLPVGYIFPSKHLVKWQASSHEKFVNLFKSLDIQNGLLFIQCLVDDGEIVPYEMGFRLTASMEYKLTEKMYGFNALKMLIRHALTGEMCVEEQFDKLDLVGGLRAANLTFLANQGKVKEVRGVDRVESLSGVVTCEAFYASGQEITEEKMGTLLQVFARVLLVSDNYDTLFGCIRSVLTEVDIISEEGVSLMLNTFDIKEVRHAYE